MGILPVIIIVILVAVISAGVTGAIVYFMSQNKLNLLKSQQKTDQEVLNEANQKALKKVADAEREASEIREQTEEKIKKMKKEIAEQEQVLVDREEALNKRYKIIDQKSIDVEQEQEQVKKLKKELENSKERLQEELEKISGMDKEEAKKQLVAELEEDIKNYSAKKVLDAEKKIREEADDKAKNILVEVMQRIVTDYVGETTTSTIKLENEDVKGRIIGKDGRNVRAFELLTGVDVIIDESPNGIGLSSFDPLRRAIAKLAMEKLILDGRIHPGSIEEEVKKAKNDIAQEIKKNGQILAEEAGWPGIDMGLLKLIGKMKYRTSYGQSLMKHSIEVVRIGATLAAELNADVDLVKKACLLHDVGKVLTHKVEGAHHHISGQIARKYNLPDKLVNAIEAHHLDIAPQSVEAVIVYMADAISGARPGARKDSYEQYIKRVEGIENAAKEVTGEKSNEIFAIHAGREVRVIVKADITTDEEVAQMSKDIAKKIQETQTYPGTVQVTVIREKRVVEMAM